MRGKGSELREFDSKNSKFKGRAVFEGHFVRDENFDHALFNEMGSSPASMAAGKAVGAWGLQPGYDLQQADAESAYTQTELKGAPTRVRLPHDRWPDSWKGMYTDPVVRLKLAFYGHPDAGTYWEQHAEKHLRSKSFVPIDDWRSCYIHPKLDLMLIVYVDDF